MGHSPRSLIEAPLIAREVLPETFFLSVIMAAMVQEAPLKIYARGVVSYFYFSRATAIRFRMVLLQSYLGTSTEQKYDEVTHEAKSS